MFPHAWYPRGHTELTMRLIKPAVARLFALFPAPENFCPGPPPHCWAQALVCAPAARTPRPNNTLLFVAHLTDNRNISVSRSPAFIVLSIPTVPTSDASLSLVPSSKGRREGSFMKDVWRIEVSFTCASIDLETTFQYATISCD